jgi:signal recognition particle receptor subunit beta
MVFFNYSTMQMAAKIVYYGPGLCGKTTNLQYIYGHTSSDSRGEMVSLETETDRTLFFDLLPIDVGTIAGFHTRIQLYTVPGQVFYNTTRKLVLKGVDGIVFVADSQRPMLQANVESFRNLEENLAEIGLSRDEVPLVLQYNKRDLKEICAVAELNSALNTANWPHFEASAIEGTGVFETLKGISKLTLLGLKKRLAKPSEAGAPEKRPAPAPPPAAAPRAPVIAAPPAAKPAAAPPPPAAEPRPMPRPAAAGPAPPAPPPRTVPPPPRPVAAPPKTNVLQPPSGPRRQVDILEELERIRRQALGDNAQAAGAMAGRKARAAAPSANGQREIAREIQLKVARADFLRARRFALNLQVQDANNQVVDAFREEVEIDNVSALEKVLLRLNIALHTEE